MAGLVPAIHDLPNTQGWLYFAIVTNTLFIMRNAAKFKIEMK